MKASIGLVLFVGCILAAGVGAVVTERKTPFGTTSEANAAAPPRYTSVLLRDVPHIRQKPDFCGEACAAMILRKLGQRVDQDYVFDQAGLDPMEARGCYTRELATALTNIGFRIGPVWYRVPRAREAEQIETQWAALHADLSAGIASIVCMRYDQRPQTSEHFRLVLGYDANSDEVIYHEPAEKDGAYQRMKRAKWLELWALASETEGRMLVRMRLEPGSLKQGRTVETFTGADYAQHLMELKKKVPSKEFTIIIQPPFVVIGDDSPAIVRHYAEGTVQWAVDRLKEAYFAKDPGEILDIWLFKDRESYETNTKRIFNSVPDTPFGYYSDADKALVMNIATGGGTLVHEIVHPFIASNFPDCPAWFNEGLGSLYEQSGEQNGRIVGYTNWRLAGLQEAIRQKQTPAFRTLCSTTREQFYRHDKGTNYAQARYLCYYLQQRDLLRKFYRDFLANRHDDPTGYGTLCAVLGHGDRDMDAFQRQWEAYVLKLRFQ